MLQILPFFSIRRESDAHQLPSQSFEAPDFASRSGLPQAHVAVGAADGYELAIRREYRCCHIAFVDPPYGSRMLDRVIETGLTDQVLDDPREPYTQLLVSSILPP